MDREILSELGMERHRRINAERLLRNEKARVKYLQGKLLEERQRTDLVRKDRAIKMEELEGQVEEARRWAGRLFRENIKLRVEKEPSVDMVTVFMDGLWPGGDGDGGGDGALEG